MDSYKEVIYIRGEVDVTGIPALTLHFDWRVMAGEYCVFYVPPFAIVPKNAMIVDSELSIYAVKDKQVTLSVKNQSGFSFKKGELLIQKVHNPLAAFMLIENTVTDYLPIAIPRNRLLTGGARQQVKLLKPIQSMFSEHDVLVIPKGSYMLMMRGNMVGIDEVTQEVKRVETTAKK